MVTYQPSVSERQRQFLTLFLWAAASSVSHNREQTDKYIDGDFFKKRKVKMAGPFYCPKSTETLNLLQTNFRAASGTVEMLMDLLTDLESLPSLITLSGEPEAGGHGVQEEVMEGVLTLTPRNSVRHELSVWHIGNPRCRQALFWHWGRRSVYVRQKVKCSMHSPKDLPCLGQSSKKNKHPHKNKSDLAETQAGMTTYAGRKLAPSEPTEPLRPPPLYSRRTGKMEKNSQRSTCPDPISRQDGNKAIQSRF